MGQSISFLEAEKKTWMAHTLKFDAQCREANLEMVSSFKNGETLALCSVTNSMMGVDYLHYFVTDYTRFLEFGAASLSIYDARVNINTTARTDYKVWSEVPMTDEIRGRMSHVLGMRNYSLCLRNCEHVANYVFRRQWVSTQMNVKGGALFEMFKEHLVGKTKQLINSFPDTIRPHVFEEKQPPVYTFTKNHYIASNFEYFLDYEESTYNVLLIGPTGAGKSHLLNVICNRQICDSETSLVSVTREIYFVRCKAVISGKMRQCILADTVGLCDTSWDETEVLNLIKDRVSSNVKAVHAVLVVVSSARLTTDFVKSIKHMMKWLDYTNNKVRFNFVITHCDGETPEKQERLKAQLRELLELGNTTYTYGEKEKGDLVVCTGFPKESLLNETGKSFVQSSYQQLCRLLFQNASDSNQVPPIQIKTGSWCTIL